MFKAKKIGGITFLQIGRINVSVSVSKSRPSAFATIVGAASRMVGTIGRTVLNLVPEVTGTAALAEESRQIALRRYDITMRNKAHDHGVRSFW